MTDWTQRHEFEVMLDLAAVNATEAGDEQAAKLLHAAADLIAGHADDWAKQNRRKIAIAIARAAHSIEDPDLSRRWSFASAKIAAAA